MAFLFSSEPSLDLTMLSANFGVITEFPRRNIVAPERTARPARLLRSRDHVIAGGSGQRERLS